MVLAPWPPLHPFPESQQESLPGAGPDFPGSSGGREQGKFRPSRTPYLTKVAITGDDGKPIQQTTDDLLRELLVYQKATVMGLSLLTGIDLIREVS